jgi:hypothetical protein
MFWAGVKLLFGALWALFKSSVCPPKTAGDQRADDLQKSVDVQAKMNRAASSAPITDDEVFNLLNDGKL